MNPWTSENISRVRPFQMAGVVSDGALVNNQTLRINVPAYEPFIASVHPAALLWMKWCVLESAPADFVLTLPSAADILRYALPSQTPGGPGVFLQFVMINRSGFSVTIQGGAATTIDGRLNTPINNRDTTTIGVFITNSTPGSEEVTVINV